MDFKRRRFTLPVDFSEISKKLNKEGIQLGPPPELPHEMIPTSIYPLDWLIEGIPTSAVTTFFGPQGSGKTTVAAHVAASIQKAGGVVVWVDNEYSFSREYFQSFGLNPDEVQYTSGLVVEQVFKLMDDVIDIAIENKDIPILFVWDSVATTPALQEREAALDSTTIATGARAMSKGFRLLSTKLSGYPKISILAITQVREDISKNVFWGPTYNLYGGYALKHYQVLALDFTQQGLVKDKDGLVKIRIRVAKSKLSSVVLGREVSLYIKHGKGVDIPKTLFEIAKDLGYIKATGGWWKLDTPNAPQKSFRSEELEMELAKEEHIKELERLWKQKNPSTIMLPE